MKGTIVNVSGYSYDVGSGSSYLCVYLEDVNTVDKIVETLESVNGFTTTEELVGGLIRNHGGRIVHYNNGWRYSSKAKYTISLSVNTVGNTVGVVDNAKTISIFSGYIRDMRDNLNPVNKLVTAIKGHVGKLVRFKYKQGSKPGATRIIRLESVDGTGSNATLKGVDLSVTLDPKKPASETGFRSFKLSQIDGGGVEVLD